MDKKSAKIAESILGDDIFEVLAKYEIYKPNTKTVVDPEEVRVALQIVPRAILSYLFAHLKPMSVGDIKDLDLPFAPNAQMHIEKLSQDNYRGDLVQDGNRISEFQYRPLPSIGLILLSTFELYDLSLLEEIKQKPVSNEQGNKIDRLQDIIDDRLKMSRMIQDVVDRRISEKEAIDRLISEKLTQHVLKVNSPSESQYMPEEDKKSKLRLFLENREMRREEPVDIGKAEIKCLDCDSTLYKKEFDSINLCLCYGEYHNKKIKFKKSNNGKVELKFPKKFNIDNIEMLLDTIKNGR